MDKSKEDVLKMAKENDVKFIRLWFTDILGFLKGFETGVGCTPINPFLREIRTLSSIPRMNSIFRRLPNLTWLES